MSVILPTHTGYFCLNLCVCLCLRSLFVFKPLRTQWISIRLSHGSLFWLLSLYSLLPLILLSLLKSLILCKSHPNFFVTCAWFFPVIEIFPYDWKIVGFQIALLYILHFVWFICQHLISLSPTLVYAWIFLLPEIPSVLFKKPVSL